MENSNLAVGAGAGVLAGAGAGLAVGNIKSTGILASQGIKKGMTQDTFVSSKIKDVMKSANYKKQSINGKINAKTAAAEKAKEIFTNTVAKAKNTKNKWIAGLAAAGLAIGAGVAFAASKINSNKQESSTPYAQYVA